ncbi:hypothetical protein ACFVIM_18305 [Streptomyces sp. NPDC057638]|uniref:hypothetical protein n=1 Tax=Streptomyces sp. NPDC057638 TaxID=3346190 RepID=UPI00369FAAE9
MARSPRTGPGRRPLTVALLLCATALGSVGCAADTGPRDDGAAAPLAPPVSASPLWPRQAVPTPTGRQSPSYHRYRDIPGVTVPKGGLRAMSAPSLMAKDPNLSQGVYDALRQCPGRVCGLRAPVHRDVTGDGETEMIVAFDDPFGAMTLIQVYRSFGTTVRPILIHWSLLGGTGETFGSDLVLRSSGSDGQITTRFRWNGAELVSVSGDTPARPGFRSASPTTFPPPPPSPPAPLPRTDNP